MQSKKKLLFLILLFFISSTVHIFNITVTTLTKYSALEPHQLASFHEEEPFTSKELKLLSNIISQNQSQNILFFGLNPQFFTLAETNKGASAIILEHEAYQRMRRYNLLRTYVKVYVVRYREVAGLAYVLLRHGREEEDCGLRESYKDVGGSRCRLLISGLSKEVYEKRWDVVVVDGPRGDRWDAPGRMSVIYTAAVMARMGRGVHDVFVHDVDRIIERWYSWEFLCHENLVSAKGKL